MKAIFFSNAKKLTTSSEREKILAFAEEGIRSVTPARVLPKVLSLNKNVLIVRGKSFGIKDKRIFVIGAGKSSAAMAVELERILGIERITAGIVVSNDGFSYPRKIIVHQADHPIPSRRGFLGARKIFALKKKFCIGKDDIVIALFSGGASALMPYPVSGVSLKDKKILTEVFLQSGIDNRKLGIVRKKISRVKGGNLAEYFYPAQIISLILSDTVGNDYALTAGGPCTEDKTTFKDAWRVINQSHIKRKIPVAISSYIKSHIEKKEKKSNFRRVFQICIGDNETALRSIAVYAKKEGMRVKINAPISGEARKVAYAICAELHKKSIHRPTLFMYGGETTVSLPRRHGKGGRNQEFVTACLSFLSRKPFSGKWAVASIATDGVDFIKESAGAVADNDSLDILHRKKFQINTVLKNHNAFPFLSRINSNVSILRGTETNVGDIILFLFL